MFVNAVLIYILQRLTAGFSENWNCVDLKVVGIIAVSGKKSTLKEDVVTRKS